MRRISIGSLLLGMAIGLVLGPFLATWASDIIASPELRRLTAPATICLDSSSPCVPLGELSEGTMLAVDSKGFAVLALRVEPGVAPNAIEPRPGAAVQRLKLQSKPR